MASTAAMAATARPTVRHRGGPLSAAPAPMAADSTATMASSGTMARSSNSRMETALWPEGAGSSPRSSSIWTMTAVEDMTKPMAPTKAAAAGAPAAMAVSVRARPLSPTWAEPRPKISRRRPHRREGRISRPMMNRKMTTPNSAKCRMVSGSRNRARPNGPIAAPAAR
ncbi:hypothetical protein D3C73_1002610 [compost metagenome]